MMNWFALILALPFLLITGALLINRPPLLSPPGPLERLKAYLATNVAETRLNHEFPEMRTPLMQADQKQATHAVVKAMSYRRWLHTQVSDGEVRAVFAYAIRSGASVVQMEAQGLVPAA